MRVSVLASLLAALALACGGFPFAPREWQTRLALDHPLVGRVWDVRAGAWTEEDREVLRLQESEDWDGLARLLSSEARNIERAGAEMLLICCNTVHKVADRIQEAIDIPLLHIADAAAWQVRAKGLEKVALLGSRFIMQENFYIDSAGRWPYNAPSTRKGKCATSICSIPPAAW